MSSVLWSLAGIVVCGGVGAVCGWLLAEALGLAGVWAALVAAPAGMVVATALFAALVGGLRRLGLLQ